LTSVNPGGVWTLGELAVESTPAVAEPAREAARGQVVYITEHGQRVAGIVSAELAAALERLSADELEEAADFATKAGHDDAAALLEDLADRAAVLAARADPRPGVSWNQLKADTEL
jgi:antitoxin (DNA-binding transcriptional repressor) of toxin-antitoxin stability system